MIQIPFAKYEGAGNDFILIDKRQIQTQNLRQLAKLCARRTQIGADGIIFVSPQNDSYRVEVLNADGSIAALCGNGLRCAFQFIRDEGENRQLLPLLTGGGWVTVRAKDGEIEADMPLPTEVKQVTITVNGKDYPLIYVNNVIPHVVLATDNLRAVPFESLAPLIRHHELFSPYGTTVNLAAPTSTGYEIRTWEVGVEAETYGCGTGSLATAIAKSINEPNLTVSMPILTRSGTTLTIGIKKVNNQVTHLSMQGPARRVFRGAAILEDFSGPL